MPVISVSMPEQLVTEIDDFIDEHGYSGRSEAMRTGARELLREFDEHDQDGETVAVVATMFDHDSEIEGTLSKLRHAHQDLVTSNVHSHAGSVCLELFVVEGTIDGISSYVSRLRAVDGVTTVEYSVLAEESSLQ